MEKIQMVDLHGQYLNIKESIDQSIQDVLDESMFINGGPVKAFAVELGDYLGIKHVIPCGNGTDALMLALLALGLEEGDEVILPVHTYVASAEVIAFLKLVPVFIDVDPSTFCIDLKLFEKAITNKTKAVMPVHLYGQCANMDEVIALAILNGIYVVEDTAQALGAEYKSDSGKIYKAGTIGDIGATSFFPSKTLGCYGDGGAMFTNDDELAEKCKMYANHGQSKKYVHDLVGCNSRLDTMQAAILRVKLRKLDEYNAKRQKIAEIYNEAFSGLDNLKTPILNKKSTHVYHQYTLVCENGRDELMEKLKAKGVPSVVYYPIPIHLQKGYQKFGYKKGELPIAESLSNSVISLPIHTELTQDQQEYIINAVVVESKGL